MFMKAQRSAVLPFLWPFESPGKYFRVAEGFEPFSNQFRKEGVTFAKPVFAYRLKYSNSITGGQVHRGDKTHPFTECMSARISRPGASSG